MGQRLTIAEAAPLYGTTPGGLRKFIQRRKWLEDPPHRAVIRYGRRPLIDVERFDAALAHPRGRKRKLRE